MGLGMEKHDYGVLPRVQWVLFALTLQVLDAIGAPKNLYDVIHIAMAKLHLEVPPSLVGITTGIVGQETDIEVSVYEPRQRFWLRSGEEELMLTRTQVAHLLPAMVLFVAEGKIDGFDGQKVAQTGAAEAGARAGQEASGADRSDEQASPGTGR
jgi:hypothetical protein